MLTPEKRTTELYRVAYKCAEFQANGCVGDCRNCQMNAALYADDPREAVLIKTSAAMDYAKYAEFRRSESVRGFVYLGIILAIVGFIVVKCSGPSKPVTPKPAPTDTVSKMTTSDLLSILTFRLRDVDGNGKIDCIDYAVCFYELDPEHIMIVRNENPQTGMNHLLNARFGEFIEPQTSNYYDYDPVHVWGKKYDPRFNVIDTTRWASQYAKTWGKKR